MERSGLSEACWVCNEYNKEEDRPGNTFAKEYEADGGLKVQVSQHGLLVVSNG